MLAQDLARIYPSYDRELQEWIATYKRGVTCRKGCGTCCNMSVGLYLPEAVMLADTLSDRQHAAVAAHAQRVLKFARTTADYLGEFRFAGLGCCPFLDTDEGTCTIYEFRPANCRHVYSNMPPEYCAKETANLLERDARKRAEFLQQLDPRVNEDDMPYIAPLHNIFYEKYALYLLMVTAKYFHVSVRGEMSWLITLARDYELGRLAATPGITPAAFIERLRDTGRYHEHLLTECQKISPLFREESSAVNFAELP